MRKLEASDRAVISALSVWKQYILQHLGCAEFDKLKYSFLNHKPTIGDELNTHHLYLQAMMQMFQMYLQILFQRRSELANTGAVSERTNCYD